MATIQTPNGVTLRISAKTGLNGLSERTRAIIAGMAQAAPSAGIAVIDITAGKEGGHLSHANGTEVDLKAYSPDGSLWTTSQRVALAAGAQAAGADRFGLYSFGKGKLGSGTMHVGFSGPGRPAAVWGADSKVRGDASRRFTDPAEKAFLASYQAGRPFDIASLSLTPLDASQAPPQDAQSAIASLIAPSGAPAIPDAPTAAMGFAPTIQDAGFPAPAASIYEGNPFGVGAKQPPAPPMPQPPPQWAQAGGFPMDEALTGQSAQDVLMGGPRMDPRRAPPGTGPMPPNMGAMLSPADVLAAGPNLRPGGAPDASMVPTPGISPMRPAVGGPNDRRPQPPNPPPRAQGIPDPRIRPDPASMPQRGFPTVFGEQPPPPMDGMSAAMGGPPAPPAPPPPSGDMYGPGNSMGRARFDNFQVMQDMAAREAQMASDQESRFLAGDLGFQRKQMERYVPEYRAPSPATMGERFDAASPFPNADQMFGLPPMNDASFPAPPPVVGTAEAGSTTGEFFTPAPPMPSPPPDPMAARFNDAFSPAGPGMIADLQGAFNRQQGRPEPGMTAQDGISEIFGAPPAPAAVPNLAIPFAEVPTGPPAPSMSPPSISQQQFDDRFGGGTVVPAPPKPGQPGVVQGEMPTPAGAMDIRSPVQGGPGLPPAPAALPQPAAPTPAPRQTNPGAERQRNGIMGRVLGGLLGGPLGALGGGLLGGGGFGGAQTFTPYGNPIMNTGMGSFRTSGTSPYGTNGTTNWKSGQSNALGGSNALQWTGSKGQTITAVTDPWTGQTYTSYGP